MRTPEGKARSAQNSLKTGLFATTDFIRPGEETEYHETRAALMRELSPEGILEENFALEIMSATWRLRRCRILEHEFSARTVLDPMVDEPTSHEQKSIDRARAQAHYLLRRAMAELRKLQTERTLRLNLSLDADSAPGLTDTKQVLLGLKANDTARLKARKAEGLDTLEALIAQADKQLCTQESSFCKTEPTVPTTSSEIPRSAPCPCGSRQKFKRCCGRNAPPVLNQAA